MVAITLPSCPSHNGRKFSDDWQIHEFAQTISEVAWMILSYVPTDLML